jgi:DNA polymerase-4
MAATSILHLDADAFFASVEQRDDPSLRGKPVAVGTGVVASCSYEARRHGVRTGMGLVEAKDRCRRLIVLSGAYPRYEQAARRILAICEDQTPIVEIAALDDLYLDLSQCGDPERASRELHTHIHDEVKLSVSIGLGTNKLVARVATKQAKPGGQIQVQPGLEETYLAPWPARILPGAGGRIGDRLERLNVHRVLEVAAMPLGVLHGLFGPRGRVLHDQARGIDPRPVRVRPQLQSLSRRNSFDPPVSDRAFLHAMLDYLVERAVSWMRFHTQQAKAMSLTLRYGDYQSTLGHERFPQPTDRELDIQGAARDCMDRLYQRRLPLRLVSIELGPLVPSTNGQNLFRDAEAERQRRLAECKDAIRRRFGFTSLLSGSALILARRLERDRENFRMRTPCLTR